MKATHSLLWFVLRALMIVSVASGLGACKRANRGVTREDAGAPVVVTEASEGLLFTYIDERGDFHVVGKPAEVPEAARDAVRVMDPNRDEGTSGDTVFVADLRKPQADGTFAVRRMKRSELEALALARRAPASPGSLGPGAGAGPSAGGAPNTNAAPPSQAAPQVIIYGAEWCGPCHQAAAFLTQRGVPFVEKNIEEDREAAREMQGKLARAGMRGGSIPVLDVKGTVLVGFSAQAVDSALRR